MGKPQWLCQLPVVALTTPTCWSGASRLPACFFLPEKPATNTSAYTHTACRRYIGPLAHKYWLPALEAGTAVDNLVLAGHRPVPVNASGFSNAFKRQFKWSTAAGPDGPNFVLHLVDKVSASLVRLRQVQRWNWFSGETLEVN